MDLSKNNISDIVGTPTQKGTRAQLRVFLDSYAATGRVRRACEVAGISRELHYHKLASDLAYKKAFTQIHQQLADVIEDELFRRAIEGESDAVLMFLARGFMPDKYRDRALIEHAGTINLAERMKAADQRLLELQATHDTDSGRHAD